MARLTKKVRARIRRAIAEAQAVEDYIMAPERAVCLRAKAATTTLHYTRADGDVLYEVTREYGSDLCRIANVKRTLEALLV